MFPGWLEHKVRPTFTRKESRDRISVAFNSAGNAMATQEAFWFPPIDIATYADAMRGYTEHGKKLRSKSAYGSTTSQKPNLFWKDHRVTSVRDFPYIATKQRKGRGQRRGVDDRDGYDDEEQNYH